MTSLFSYQNHDPIKYDNLKRLPNGHRFVKQQGYKRGNFHNWAIFDKEGFLISLGGRTKKDARIGAFTHFNPSKYN